MQNITKLFVLEIHGKVLTTNNSMNREEILQKIIEWATGDDTGTSSKFLCRYMLGLEPNKWGMSCPSDASDRGRCIRLLNLIPEWWDRLDELANLPSRVVIYYSGKGIRTNEEGWKEQIPLIRKESEATK